MQELIENIQSIEGLLEFNIEPGYWQDEDGNEVQVNLIILHHLFSSFEDETYLELMSLFPENTDEYEDEEGYYVSTFIDYKV